MSEKPIRSYIRPINPDDNADMAEMMVELLEFINERYPERRAQLNTVLIHIIALGIPDEECLDIACDCLEGAFYTYNKRSGR